MIEYEDVDERRDALAWLKGIEDLVWIRVSGHDKVRAIADEDLEREDDSKTSGVHFLRVELTPKMISAVKQGADVSAGVDHPDYSYSTELRSAVQRSLAADLA